MHSVSRFRRTDLALGRLGPFRRQDHGSVLFIQACIHVRQGEYEDATFKTRVDQVQEGRFLQHGYWPSRFFSSGPRESSAHRFNPLSNKFAILVGQPTHEGRNVSGGV